MHLWNSWRNRTRYEKCLLCLFVFTLPLVNPWVRGDGVGYYAYARALLIEGRLDFEKDWLEANPTFRMGRVDSQGHILANQYTCTGHLDNHFTIGPAILWSPFLLTAHLAVKVSDALGAHIPADGFSRPYSTAMACGTAFYGFLGLWLSFRIAKKYFPERWAFLATLGIWFASSLPVYLYFNPSWSHAHSAFMVALFVWYWLRTRDERTSFQWILLGLIAGLMMDVYYPNAILVILPGIESLRAIWSHFQESSATRNSLGLVLARDALFVAALLLALSPTFLSRWVVYGSVFESGYIPVRNWHWISPVFGSVLFSSDHGLFSWTPVLALACAGLVIFGLREARFGGNLLLVLIAFYYFIASYPDWDGVSSFGNRFFVSLTVLFILGLAALFDWLARVWEERDAAILASVATACLILWNLGLVFQWGTHLIPARGRISWRSAVHNQVAIVPLQASHAMMNYLTQRKQLMNRIEQEDAHSSKQQIQHQADSESQTEKKD
jgi:hypothetical protein